MNINQLIKKGLLDQYGLLKVEDRLIGYELRVVFQNEVVGIYFRDEYGMVDCLLFVRNASPKRSYNVQLLLRAELNVEISEEFKGNISNRLSFIAVVDYYLGLMGQYLGAALGGDLSLLDLHDSHGASSRSG